MPEYVEPSRERMLQEFDVYPENPVVIREPGKFEAEAIWVPYFWELSMHGGGDEEVISPEGTYVIMEIRPEDLAQFPELRGSKSIMLKESEQGFVSGELSDDPPSAVADWLNEDIDKEHGPDWAEDHPDYF